MPLMFEADLVAAPLRRARRGERRVLRAPAQCRRGSMRETVVVLDLSPSGARLRAVSPLRTGHSIWLKLPGLEAKETRVVWTRGFESGCEFLEPLHPAVFDSLMTREARAAPH